MEHLTIVGTEDGVLVLATESGSRFLLAIDDVLRDEVRKDRSPVQAFAKPLAASPREIQTHIRSGLSASQTAEWLGVTVADVQRFEGPVLAEREHVIAQALAIPVLMGSELEPDAVPSFGDAIREKLEDLQATDERWASWKSEDGWQLKLEFTANEIDHDARWSFDVRSRALSPLNADATQLSRQGPLPEGLIPRLRAIGDEPQSPYKDTTRFDSGAFGPRSLIPIESEEADAGSARKSRFDPEESIKPADHPGSIEFLEALRRKRGQREGASFLEEFQNEQTTEPEVATPLNPLALFESRNRADSAPGEENRVEPEPGLPLQSPTGDSAVPGDRFNSTSENSEETHSADAASSKAAKRRRNSMPSWDEIVFGARSED